jgi:LysR family transcriptional regulator, glycine cleavage system transcriptional activator
MRRILPSCQSLRVFEAAARHLSFTKAGDDLLLTQGAVSQQIKLLEDRLQAKLFRRSGRSLMLTSTGECLYPIIRNILEQMSDVVDMAHSPELAYTLIVYAPYCFASKWLIPRISNFEQQHPNIHLWIKSGEVGSDVLAEENAVAISIGEGGDDQGIQSEILTFDSIFPVCSPGIVPDRDSNKRLIDLEHHRLLGTSGPQRESCCCDWSIWFNQHNKKEISCNTPLRFSNCAMAIDAAVAGHGVALARSLTVESALDSGALIRICSKEIPSPLPYRLFYSKLSAADEKIRQFRSWLLAQFTRRPTAEHGGTTLLQLRHGTKSRSS